jgi:hypothetical protein
MPNAAILHASTSSTCGEERHGSFDVLHRVAWVLHAPGVSHHHSRLEMRRRPQGDDALITHHVHAAVPFIAVCRPRRPPGRNEMR